MVTISLFLIVSGLAAPWQATAPQPSPRITCEFRVFDGGDEVSRETRVLVYPSGRRENGVPIDASGRVPLEAGLYDVQAIRERNGQVTGIRWVEHLLIQRYPDEEGHHLEIINFNARYGALELKPGNSVEYDVAAFAAGDRTRAVATALPGVGYVLLVLPAGLYDLRIKARDASAPEKWLPEIDVPAGRTRLRTIPAA